jgi:bloom syndrome protein
MVSSPAAQRRKPAERRGYGADEDDSTHTDFVVSDDGEDAFEPIPDRRRRREETLGPPITLDERMASLPDFHRVSVTQFVEAAKTLEEKIRNKHNLRNPLFTETNFREMAIRWTVTLGRMMQIPDINGERVKTYGSQFIPLVTEYHSNYNETISRCQDDRVIDRHENVIDLISDEECEEDSDLDGEDEATTREAEQGSKYFAKPQYGSNLKSGNASSRNLPFAAGSDAKSSSYRGRGGSYRAKGRGGKRSFSRKSNGSASGQSSFGVSKRKFSGGAKKTRASKSGGSNSTRGSTLMRSFGNNGGGGTGGGGIGMMPT